MLHQLHQLNQIVKEMFCTLHFICVFGQQKTILVPALKVEKKSLQ